MKIRQVVSNLRQLIKQVSADSVINDRTIASELKNAAALLIRRELLLRRLWSSASIFEQIKCLTLCEVPLAECCSYSSACTIRKSSCRIKGLADLGTFGMAIQGVFSVDGTKKFKEANPSRYENILRLKIPDKKSFFWFMDGYLYITDPDIEAINLVAYFESDLQLEGENCSCTNAAEKSNCINPLDLEFRCPAYLIENASQMVLDKLARIYKSSSVDGVSDEKDDSR